MSKGIVMKKYLRIALVFVIAVIFFLIGRYILKNNEYVLSFQANRNIKAYGLEFMMTQEEVRKVLGMEDHYFPGWGGYRFEYIEQGIFITFLDDRDTKFYNKVIGIEVLNSNYKIYNVHVGMQYNEALERLNKQGFHKDNNGWLWKGNIYISLYKSHDQLVNKIKIGIKDRISSKRVY